MLAELRAAQDAMREAARLTPEGLQEVFEDGFNKAMEAFDAQERKLTLDYELKIADDQKLVTDAENQIAAIRYMMDDYEADLKGIQDQEEDINDIYDEKLEALEKMRKVNQKLLDQEKGKLSVAEAITRGDLAAAARAAQEVRATSASGYFSSQTDALESGRQSALNAVRSENGLSRIEIEERLEELADNIFEIEENTLEPAQERIRLAGIELQSRIDELEVLGRTKDEWERIKNNIDLARTNSVMYKEAMEEALNVVQDVLDAWNGIQSKTVVLTTIQRTLTEGSSTDGAGTGGGGQVNQAQIDQINSQADPYETTLNSQVSKWKSTPSYRTQGNYNAILQNINNFNSKMDEIKNAGGTPDKKYRLIGNSKSPNLDLQRYAMGGKVGYYPMGGLIPYKAMGGMFKTVNTDSVPAMLTPGEFVVRRKAVQKFGEGNLEKINSGEFSAGSIGNSLSVSRYQTPDTQYAPRDFNNPVFLIPSNSVPESKGISSIYNSNSALPPSQTKNSVYNYSLSVNVASQSDPNTIAQTVMNQLRMVDSQRVRSNRF
jgi:hypothetical protein